MTRPIERDVLRALWPCYLDGLPATDKHFEDGLEWALRPVYRSVALLQEHGHRLEGLRLDRGLRGP